MLSLLFMFKIAFAKLDNVTVTSPHNCELEQLFGDLSINGRPFVITTTGTVGQALFVGDARFGCQISFKYKVPSDEYTGWSDLNALLDTEGGGTMLANFVSDPEDYTRVDFLDSNFMIRFKLNRNKEGRFRFGSNIGEVTTEMLTQQLVEGANVSVITKVGMYVNKKDKKCGIFFTILDLDFDVPKTPVATKLSKRRHG